MIIQRRNKTTRQVLGTAAAAMSAAIMVALTPTTASAFDIGGLIGAAIAANVGHYHGGYAGGGHSHTRVASRHDDHDSSRDSSNVERDARDPDPATPPPPGKSDNRVAVRQQKIQGPSSSSGGTAQASERDAATAQVASAGKSFDDAPSFNPSR